MKFVENNDRNAVIPAKAGIHSAFATSTAKWIPAFAGMTICKCGYLMYEAQHASA